MTIDALCHIYSLRGSWWHGRSVTHYSSLLNCQHGLIKSHLGTFCKNTVQLVTTMEKMDKKLINVMGMSTTCLLVTARLQLSRKEYLLLYNLKTYLGKKLLRHNFYDTIFSKEMRSKYLVNFFQSWSLGERFIGGCGVSVTCCIAPSVVPTSKFTCMSFALSTHKTQTSQTFSSRTRLSPSDPIPAAPNPSTVSSLCPPMSRVASRETTGSNLGTKRR